MESYRENIGKQCKVFISEKLWVFYFITYAGCKMLGVNLNSKQITI